MQQINYFSLIHLHGIHQRIEYIKANWAFFNWKAITASHAPNDHINCQHYVWHPPRWSSAWGALSGLLETPGQRERGATASPRVGGQASSQRTNRANDWWMDLPRHPGFVSWEETTQTFMACCRFGRQQKRENRKTSPSVYLEMSAYKLFSSICSSFQFAAHLSCHIFRLQDIFTLVAPWVSPCLSFWACVLE